MSLESYNKVLDKTLRDIQKRKIDIVVIGASLGGTIAIENLIKAISTKINVPIIIVQHMCKDMTIKFANRLDSINELNIVEVSDNERLVKGKVYIAKADYHLVISKKGIASLNSEVVVNGVRPAVDNLFTSVAKTYKEKVLAIVLTGMGRDGAKGIIDINKAGGYCVTQAEESCFIYGMPKACVETGVVNAILPLEYIASIINLLV